MGVGHQRLLQREAVAAGQLLAQWGTDGTADFNNDGFVDGNDLGQLLAAWGQCPGA